VIDEQSGGTTVLIVEDEAELADLYADYLRGSYAVDVAYGGEKAIEMLSDALSCSTVGCPSSPATR